MLLKGVLGSCKGCKGDINSPRGEAHILVQVTTLACTVTVRRERIEGFVGIP
jgi:hypothetical protein